MAGSPQAAPGVPRQMIGKSSFICNECVRLYARTITTAEVATGSLLIPEIDLGPLV